MRSPPVTGACGRGRPFARRPTGSGGGAWAPEETRPARSPTRPGAALASRPPAGPRPVINATGVLLHTNLGRAPLAVSAREAVLRACGYSTLELDLATGARGNRGEHVRPLLLQLFAPGREDLDALAVTNTAAALLLALDTVADGRPVAVSRGELVAIGGDFRVPSILARSGASLLEVGTTNKTTPEDYAEAVRAGAAAILKVRPSNYRIVGFTEEVSLGETRRSAGRRESRSSSTPARVLRNGSPSRDCATSRFPPRRSPREPRTSSASRATRRSADRRRGSSSAPPPS